MSVSSSAGVASRQWRRELQRKALHLLTAVVPIAYALGAPRYAIVLAMAVAVVIALVVETLRRSSDRSSRKFHELVGPLLREHEGTRWVGATWLVITFLVLALLVDRSTCIAAMWSVSAGDALAALVGRSAREFAASAWFARSFVEPRGAGGKTLIGSAACFTVVFVGCLLLARLSYAESAVASAVATIAEWPTHVVDDNLRIGVAVAIGILLWRFVFS